MVSEGELKVIKSSCKGTMIRYRGDRQTETINFIKGHTLEGTVKFVDNFTNTFSISVLKENDIPVACKLIVFKLNLSDWDETN